MVSIISIALVLVVAGAISSIIVLIIYFLVQVEMLDCIDVTECDTLACVETLIYYSGQNGCKLTSKSMNESLNLIFQPVNLNNALGYISGKEKLLSSTFGQQRLQEELESFKKTGYKVSLNEEGNTPSIDQVNDWSRVTLSLENACGFSNITESTMKKFRSEVASFPYKQYVRACMEIEFENFKKSQLLQKKIAMIFFQKKHHHNVTEEMVYGDFELISVPKEYLIDKEKRTAKLRQQSEPSVWKKIKASPTNAWNAVSGCFK